MSLCLYAGPLTRYYTRDFQAGGARLVREHGPKHEIRSGNRTPDRPSLVEMPALIAEFRAAIADTTGANHPQFAKWREDGRVYRAEQLSPAALNALLLALAYSAQPDLTLPDKLPAEIGDDPAYRSAIAADNDSGLFAVLQAQIFLPEDAPLMLALNDPVGLPVTVSTAGALRAALERLDHSLWQGQGQAQAWFTRGPAMDADTMGQQRSLLAWWKKPPEQRRHPQEGTLMHDAEYAFGCFSEMLSFAIKHQLPLRRDE